MLNAASVRQPLAEAAARLRVEREVVRIMGEGVRGIPPAADAVGERRVHRFRRCVDRGGVPYDKADGGALDHLAPQWRDEDREEDRKGHVIRSHRSTPLTYVANSPARWFAPDARGECSSSRVALCLVMDRTGTARQRE